MSALNRLAERIFGQKVTVMLAVDYNAVHVEPVTRRVWSNVATKYGQGTKGVLCAIPAVSGMEKITFGTVHRGQTYIYVELGEFDKFVRAMLKIDAEFAATPNRPTEAYLRAMKGVDM